MLAPSSLAKTPGALKFTNVIKSIYKENGIKGLVKTYSLCNF